MLTSQERQLFQVLHEERLHDAKTFNKPSYRGIWTGIVDKYKEKAHFVYELLQNADDAQATLATFTLEKDRLIFRHNGKVGFSVSSEDDQINKGHINAITGVGNSTKDENKGNTIGKFGVGFKAVFQYTNVPHIYDDKFWFKIENYIVPTLLEQDFQGREKGETVFVFPFTAPNDAYKEITERLRTLDNPILFLRHLQKVRIDTPERKNIVYSKEIIDHLSYGNVSHDLILVSNYGRDFKMHMFTEEVKINNEGNLYTQYISVGYFLDRNGKLDVTDTRKVFCFFPTAESFKLKCVVHAPFLLVDSRQQLKDSTVNSRLKQLLANLASKSLVYLRDYGLQHNNQLLIDENLFSIIPEKDSNYYHPDNLFRDAYLNTLRTNSLLLSRENKYIPVDEAKICRPISMMNILTDKQLTELNWFDDVEEDEQQEYHFLRDLTQKMYSQNYVRSILSDLDIEVYDGENLADDITSDFMERHGIKWAKRLYTHLRNEQVGLWKRSDNTKKQISETPFCLAPIILTSSEKWESAYQKSGSLNLYFPLSGASDGYSFVHNDFLKDKDCVSFFKDLGIKEPDAWDYIDSVVLKKYSEKGTLYKEDIIKDFEVIYQYITKIKNAKEREDRLLYLRQRYTIVCKDNYLRKPEFIYESNSGLDIYFGNSKVVNNTYYSEFIDKYSIQDFSMFIKLLGVASIPRIMSVTRRDLSYQELRNIGVANHTWARLDDYIIDGFEFWQPKSLDESKAFWRWFSIIYSDKSKRQVTCTYQYYQVRTCVTDASFIKAAKSKKWIFTAEKKLQTPTETSLEQLEEAEYYIDYDLIKLFGIEKKTKSLAELGASANQIEQNEKGKLAEKYGFDTEEDFKEAQAALKEKREREQARRDNKNNDNHQSDLPKEDDQKSSKMRKTSLDDMSSSSKDYGNTKPKVQKSTDERVQDITQKLADEANKKIEEENLRASVSDLEKYTKQWFESLMELEYNTSMTESDYNRSQIKISFEKFRKENDSTQIYVLSNPSRNIPVWIEEIGGLTVKFSFLNKDDLSVSFDVANVKDFTLRLKAKLSDVASLDRLDWTKCTKAVVEVNNPVEIMNKLKTAFSALEFEDSYNFKNNLKNNISFVFGPPGTGKTTRLAEIISTKMNYSVGKILVLAPTNKACDVLTRKLLETNKDDFAWLGRFVATGEEELETSGVLIERDSELWKRDKCCIISTIARLPYDGFTESYEQNSLLKDIDWNFVIIDEASMIPLVQIVYAIYKLPKAKFIIAGDPLQISPIVKEKGWIGENIYTMVNLNNFDLPKTEPIQFDVEKLQTQYRSVPAIGSLYSKYSYDGKLLHNRSDTDLLKLPFGGIAVKPVTFVPFRVERFDSIFGSKKLNGSNVHIYSAIFAVETCAFIAKQQFQSIRIGVICPYAPQAQLINKMIEQRVDLPANVDIQCGTVHGFQGDQCEIIITVLNPPTGIKAASDRIMLNNKNVLNVAISRASDYLFVLMPHPDSYGYENLIEINKLCKLAKDLKSSAVVINADEVEKSIFGSRNFIEANTFVTTHQMANVYSKSTALYEVRIDDHAVDIQVGGDSYAIKPSYFDIQNNNSKSEEVSVGDTTDLTSDSEAEESIKEDSFSIAELSTLHKEILQDRLNSIKHSNLDIEKTMKSLIDEGSDISVYLALQIVGNEKIRAELTASSISKEKLKSIFSSIKKTPLINLLGCWLHLACQNGRCPFKNYTNKYISALRFEEFKSIYSSYLVNFTNAPLVKKKKKSNTNPVPIQSTNVSANRMSPLSHYRSQLTVDRSSKSEDKLYDRYEYGLSDW